MNRKTLLILAYCACSGFALFVSRAETELTAGAGAVHYDGLVKLNLELDRPLLPADSAETVILKVGLDGLRRESADRPPLNVALVIDRSGSMSGEKIHQAKIAAHRAVDRLASGDVVSLIVYGSEASVYWPASRVGNARGLHEAIDRIETRGNTNLFGGIELGAAELRQRIRRDFVHRVILLSDGLANVGPSSPRELAGLGAELRTEGIVVSTVGLGLGYNEDLMVALARRSDGNTYFVENSRDLPYVFDQEFGDAMNVVARDLLVEVDCPEGMTPLRIIGRDGRVERQRVIVKMNQLYGGREQFALIEVRVDPGRARESRKLADVRMSYQERAETPRQQIAGVVDVAFTTNDAEVRSRANHQVQTDYSLNRLAEVKEKVIQLNDQGRAEEAQRELESLAASQRQLSSSYANAAVAELAASVEKEAEEFRRNGMDNASRKSYRADSFQIMRQQKRP